MAVPQAPARQRWRLVLARAVGATEMAGRDLSEAFENALEATGLPLQRPVGRLRTRVAFGAPLPLGTAAERELADVTLTEVLPIWRVRDSLAGHLPAGWTLVDLFDVWLGAPALAGRVNGAIYRVVLEADNGSSGRTDTSAIAAAAADLLRQGRVPRTRLKGGSTVAYDLRPLLADVRLLDPGPPVVVRIQTRIHPELGTGRPTEVLAALEDHLGCPLGFESITRECLIVAGEPG